MTDKEQVTAQVPLPKRSFVQYVTGHVHPASDISTTTEGV
jgi:hypothetical protein